MTSLEVLFPSTEDNTAKSILLIPQHPPVTAGSTAYMESVGRRSIHDAWTTSNKQRKGAKSATLTQYSGAVISIIHHPSSLVLFLLALVGVYRVSVYWLGFDIVSWRLF